MTTRTGSTKTSDVSYLVELLGPEEAAEITGPLSQGDTSMLDDFAQHLTGMTDDDLRSKFHADDALIASLREFQKVCGF
jgi:hypothetical protein